MINNTKITLLFGVASWLLIEPNSCNKDNAGATTEQLLTAKTWKAEEVRSQLSDNTTQYYKRGVVGTLYDSDSLKFTARNTGRYYYARSSCPITWNFTDAAKTKMTIVIDQQPYPITVYLENIHITVTFFKYAQYYNGSDINYLASCTRLPN